MCNFSHLHVHTDASKIDGLGPVNKLVYAASQKGFKHLAITDHGTLANVIAFDSACKEYNVKPIIGLEGYITEAGNTYHITLLADGNKGFENIVNLNNIGVKSGHSKPVFTIQNLLDHSDNVIVLSGCPSSPLQELDWKDARRIAIKLKDTFQDRFFSELMFVVETLPSWERSIQLAQDLDLQLVLTNDVHYAEKEYAPVHKVLTNLKGGFEYDDTHLWLAQPQDMIDRVNIFAPEFSKYLIPAMENAYNLADKLSKVKLSSEPKLPHIPDSNTKLYSFTKTSLHNQFNDDISSGIYDRFEQYENRMYYELDTIKEMDFSAYFLILKDIIDYARSIGVKIGPGRGSGVGSLVLYLLGVTELDPIEHKLSFERFLNPKRVEMPDVDVDIDSDGRDLVIKYAAEKWGGIPVATYGDYNEKSLIRELIKYFGGTKEQSDNASDEGVDGKTFQSITAEKPLMRLCYDVMLGQIKYAGKHAGGIIITDQLVPFELDTNGNIMAGWSEGVETKELSKAGIVKFDLLGVKALSVLKILETKHGKAKEPTDDSPVWELFHTGKTTGVFQFSGSAGVIEYTKKVKPEKFDDLVAINALYRPGALDAGTAQMYPIWKTNPRKLHPVIDDILEDTYGVICFQEQFMSMYARVTDGDLADADFARKVIVKAPKNLDLSNVAHIEWKKKYDELQEKFLTGCNNKSIDTSTAQGIWNEISAHSRYSFNRAHSAAYSYTAWQMAYFKYYHPVDYYAALLSIHPENSEEYIFAAVMDGIDIVMPDINNSTENYESDGTKIYMPLSAVYGLSENGTQAILEAKPFTSLEDFTERVPKKKVNKRAKKGLYALGAFNSLVNGHSKEDQLNILGIDDVTETTDEMKQISYLGYTIPTKNLMQSIQNAARMGYIGGVIVEKIDKQSNYGKYKTYKLMPSGSVWARGKYEDLEVGQKLAFKTSDNRKILMIKELE